MTSIAYNAEPYKNHLRQLIEPGEEVLVLTSQYKSTVVKEAIFVGVKKDGLPVVRYSDGLHKVLELGRVYEYDTPLSSFLHRKYL